VELAGGRVLMSGGGEFRTSDDGGLTWSEPYAGQGPGGEPARVDALTNLSDGAIGGVARLTGGDTARLLQRLGFCRSSDEGRTWSEPAAVNPDGPGAHVWQDMLCRTSSGRIVLPAYLSLGQGGFHTDGAPFVGGYVEGVFVSSDAHFVDPHFGASFTFYSDDDGHTWQRSEGELLINLEPGGHCEPTYEPSVTEVSPGKLLMILRTRLGRHYQAWSQDNGESWSRPQATQLAGTHVPAQVRTLRGSGHLLCVFNQNSAEEIRQGFVRTRLSAAVSRMGGRLWEFFRNVESIHPEPHVEPGPIQVYRPAGQYMLRETGARECDTADTVPLPVGYGRWSYPSVLVLDDRVLISHTYSWHDETGASRNGGGSRLKVLPLNWFYGGHEPDESALLKKLESLALPPEP